MKQMLLAFLFLISQYNSSDTISLTIDGQKVDIINKNEFSLSLFDHSVIDYTKYNKLMNELTYKIFKKPRNAFIDSQGKIIPGKNGYKLDSNTFQKVFFTYFYMQGSHKIEVPKHTIYPRVDSELLDNIRAKLIGRYVTYFNGRNKERTHNIKLAAASINNYVVFPGETFSFNSVVGKRTIKRGYLSAPVIVKGELTEGIGGGICQVSSTLYNAVDRAGVKIIQRYSHSKRVPYVPPGRDATVSWYGPDFKFKNVFNQPILIRSQVIGGSMIVNIFSSDEVHYKPREIPKAPNKLPKEIFIGSD